MLAEALRWQRRHGGRIGPAGFAHVRLAYTATEDDRAAEGWGLPEEAGDAPEAHRLDFVSAERQALFRRALEWQIAFLKEHPGSAQVLRIWLACKLERRPFGKVLAELGLARGHAYRLRDRALGTIAAALEWQREPLPWSEDE